MHIMQKVIERLRKLSGHEAASGRGSGRMSVSHSRQPVPIHERVP